MPWNLWANVLLNVLFSLISLIIATFYLLLEYTNVYLSCQQFHHQLCQDSVKCHLEFATFNLFFLPVLMSATLSQQCSCLRNRISAVSTICTASHSTCSILSLPTFISWTRTLSKSTQVSFLAKSSTSMVRCLTLFWQHCFSMHSVARRENFQ